MDDFEVDMSPNLDGLRIKKEYRCEMEHVNPLTTTFHAINPSIRPASLTRTQT